MAAAAAALRERGCYIIRLTSAREPSGWTIRRRSLAREEEWALLAKQLAALLHAGIDVVTALHLLAHGRRERLSKALRTAATEVAGGSSLAAALAAQGVPPLLVQLVAAGEAGGVLAENLVYADTYYRMRAKLRRTWQEALAYPALVMLLAAAVGLLSVYVILPVFADMFANLGTTPTGLTATVLTAATFAGEALPWLFGLLVCLILGGGYALRTTRGGKYLAKQGLRFRLYRYLLCARLARVQSLLLRSGLDFTESLRLSAATADSYTQERFAQVRALILGGRDPAEAFRQVGWREEVWLHMLKIGTESGNLAELLQDTALYYEAENARLIRRYRTWLGPLVLLFVGLWVGVLLYSLVLPIMDAILSLEG